MSTLQKPTPEGQLEVNGRLAGFTNVTRDSVTGAAKFAGSRSHEVTTLKVKPTIFCDLRMSGQIHFQLDGKPTFLGVLNLVVEDTLPHDWTVYDSHLCNDAGEVLAVLRTREY